MSNEQHRKANRNAALRWGGFVVTLLSLQVAGGAYAIYLATGDASVAVVPDYHEKALNWDRDVQLRAQSAKLNWSVQLDVTKSANGQALVIQVRDDAGQYVAISSGKVQLYHHARAGNVLRVRVESTGEPIVVDGSLSMPGLWQVELDLTDSEGRRFVDSRQLKVGENPEAAG